MTRRSYGQFCGLARALDVVGERWTLLVIRDLLPGPRRFSDLLEGLPGIGTSLLSERLKHLEACGVVRRDRLPPPAASAVYDLTERGRGLAPALLALADWGVPLLAEGRERDAFRPEWVALFLQAAADTEAAAGIHETYEFRIGGHVLHFVVNDGRIEARQGASPTAPALRVTTDPTTFVAVGLGRLTAAEAGGQGRATMEGDPAALQRALDILRPPSARAAPPPVPAPRRH